MRIYVIACSPNVPLPYSDSSAGAEPETGAEIGPPWTLEEFRRLVGHVVVGLESN